MAARRGGISLPEGSEKFRISTPWNTDARVPHLVANWYPAVIGLILVRDTEQYASSLCEFDAVPGPEPQARTAPRPLFSCNKLSSCNKDG